MRRIQAAVILAALALSIVPARAVQPDEMLPDAAQEARARNLSAELRCLVCQNQSIDDSDAPLARDLRLLVREKIAAGKRDDEVLDFIVARYGQYVLLRPRFDAVTALLWVGPFAIVGIGGVFLWRAARRRRNDAILFGLTDEEEARLEKLLKETEERNLTNV